MVNYMNTRLIKTVIYRLSATLIAQLTSFALFQSIEVNLGVLLADTVQMGWFYIFDRFWEQHQPFQASAQQTKDNFQKNAPNPEEDQKMGSFSN